MHIFSKLSKKVMGFIGWKKYGVYKQEKVYSLYVSLENPAKLNKNEKFWAHYENK